MANQEQLETLKKGIAAWNEWKKSPSVPDADLSGIDLSKQNLQGADFSDTHLQNANLKKADLTGANLSKAHLNGANLAGAILKEANLSGAKFRRADLCGAVLTKANFKETDCTAAIFKDAVLSSAQFQDAVLEVADFRSANLSQVNLKNAILKRANLIEADLSYSSLEGTNLCSAYLVGSNLTRTELSRAVIDDRTLRRATKLVRLTPDISGCIVGVNGIWCEGTDTAALISVNPPGNSMQGPNQDAVIESLKRARRLHGFSMSLVGLVLLMMVLDLSKIAFPYAKDINITPVQFSLLAWPISIALIILTNIFFADAAKGSRYLKDRGSAMTVGNFPWILCRYAKATQLLISQADKEFLGDLFSEPIAKINQGLSLILPMLMRVVYSFHPLVYVYAAGHWMVFGFWSYLFLTLITMWICLRTFFLSSKFQKPIVFDRITEENRVDPVEKLTDAVETMTHKMAELVDTIQDLISSNDQRKSGHK